MSLEANKQLIQRLMDEGHNRQDAGAAAAFYTEDATMQENLDPPRVGQDVLVAHETKALQGVKQVLSRCMRPVFIDGDCVVIRWQFEFERHDGQWMRMDELAYQHWRGNLIETERFYYDPKQMRPQLAETLKVTATGGTG